MTNIYWLEAPEESEIAIQEKWQERVSFTVEQQKQVEIYRKRTFTGFRLKVKLDVQFNKLSACYTRYKRLRSRLTLKSILEKIY